MKIYFFIFNLLIFNELWACPGCAGSMENPKDTYLVYILMVFIGLIYFPMMHLFRMIYKFRNINSSKNHD